MAEDAKVAEENNSKNSITTPPAKNMHKPLTSTKSHPTFRSMDYIAVKKNIELEEGQRSRSNSAPMSREAIRIAQNIRTASDNFANAAKMRKRRRRRTLGSFMHSSIEKEMIQLALEEEPDLEAISPLLGTPV